MNCRAVLSDLHAVQAAGHEMRALMAGYRLALMQSGLWDAAPTVWEARVASLAEMGTQIESEMYGIDNALRRIDTAVRLWQTRLALLQGERERLLIYLAALLGLALLTVLIADTSRCAWRSGLWRWPWSWDCWRGDGSIGSTSIRPHANRSSGFAHGSQGRIECPEPGIAVGIGGLRFRIGTFCGSIVHDTATASARS